MKKGSLVKGVEIIDIGAKGKVIGKKDGQVFITSGAVPGDMVTVEVRKNKKTFKEGRVREIESFSTDRTEPVCSHFDFCGGCSWQSLKYSKQLELKEKNVEQQLKRIAGLNELPTESIVGADKIYDYRNKLEFTFVNHRWLTPSQLSQEGMVKDEGLGFHVPGRFDWILHINNCHLQDPEHNSIRNFCYTKARELGISFYDPHTQKGTLRNLVLRNNRRGEWMLILIIKEASRKAADLAAMLAAGFPSIVSLWQIINPKANDSYSDCEATLLHGVSALTETFERPTGNGKVEYNIGPLSFFQTNSHQAEKLYGLIYEWAGLNGTECVYDLYTGTGSIALYVADRAEKVIGIEYVPEAIVDAEKNANLNNIQNCSFFAGDMKDLLNTEFIAQHGKPDVIITDPPRAGMHPDVVNCILAAKPERIVYVSCDPATQARDLSMLKDQYTVVKSRAFDMFPHTSHVENVLLLKLTS